MPKGTTGNRAERLGRFLLRRHRELLLGGAFLIAAAAPFDHPARGPAATVAFVSLLVAAVVSLVVNRPRPPAAKGGGPQTVAPLPPSPIVYPAGFLLMAGVAASLAVNFLVQSTGRLHSPLWPAYFVVLAALALGPGKVLAAGGVLAAVLALESANLLMAGAPQVDGPLFLGYAGALAACTAATGWISHRGQASADRLRLEHERLKDNARSLVELDVASPAEERGILSRDFRRNHWVGAALELDSRLASLLRLAAGSLGADSCSLHLVDDSGEHLVLRQHHPPKDDPPAARVPLAGTIHGKVVRTAEPVTLGSLDSDDGRPTLFDRGARVRSLAAAPVISHGTVIGVLSAEAARADAFRDRKDVLTGFADEVAEVFISSQRVVRKQEEGRKYEAMSLISSVLSSSLKEQDILQVLLDETASLIGYRVGAFFSAGEEGMVVLRVARGLPVEAIGKSYPIGKCLLGMVATHNRHLFLGDIGEGRRRTTVLTGLPLECRSLVAVPVGTGDRVEGIFLAADPRPWHFDRLHLDIFGVLANQVAVQLSNALLHERMERMAITDGLTGLVNHRHFHERLIAETTRLKRHPEPLSLIILDIDHFKRVNDTYGHPFGDVVLKGVAALLKELAREIDVVARYGGEEMAILLVATDRKGTESMAQRVMKGLRKLRFEHEGKTVSVTASLGSATWPVDGDSPVALVRAADEALYRSKREGRDRYTPAGAAVAAEG